MRPNRFAPLKAAVLLAAGFIALRVVYRVVFGGAGGGGLVLLDLPRIRLSGPFEHIVLFGPVTTGGLLSATASALPFAALVLVCGVLSTIIDIRGLLTRGAVRGPMRTVSRALAIAWATFPALVESVRRVRVARDLRGERGAAALVVPVLEQTVERAIALGASMEVRGFASRRRAQPTCERPASVRAASLGYEGRWVLDDIDLELEMGTLVLVTGATGSGKSTLLHSLSGLFQHLADGDQAGWIEVAGVDRLDVPPRDTAGFVGVVSQSVRLSFVAATVAEELGFSLAIRGVAPVIVRARVADLADRLGISHLVGRDVSALSAGEACLVAIGAALIEQPVLLLVDEPLADLDTAARSRVVGVLDRLAHEAGVCVVVVEHAISEWADAPDVRLEIRDGVVQRVDGSAAVPAREVAEQGATGDVVASIQNLSVTHGGNAAVTDASLELRAGEIVALIGPNGAGKSSLLHAMARPRMRGAVLIEERDVERLSRRERRRSVALVPEAFDDLLFATTVAAECRRADVGAGRSGTADTFLRLVGEPAAAILGRHPRDLSAGERLCLVLAIQMAARSTVLLVDEPSRGLDAAARALVGAALRDAAQAGTAVLIATHDQEFAAAYASRTITMAAGHLDSSARVTS